MERYPYENAVVNELISTMCEITPKESNLAEYPHGDIVHE